MKKFLPSLLCIWFAINASAQKIHFTDTSNVWYQFSDAYNDGNPPILTYGVHHYIKDSTISSVAYVVFDFGTVREDTVLRKVYMRDFAGDTDIVLIDYNLHVGDSFAIGGASYVVSGIDSTEINGVWHRVWHFPQISSSAGSNWPSDIIEGIGCIQHPTYMFWHGFGVEAEDWKEYCFSNKGFKPHFSPSVKWFDNATSCTTFPTLNIDQMKSRNKITLYPNPASTLITITESEDISAVVISNLMGQIVYSTEHKSQQIQINVENLPTGVYCVKINGAEVRKFLKE